MTISSTTNRASFTGNGVTRAFSFPYALLERDDLKVYVDGTLKTLTTHYTITGSPIDGPWPDGVTVTFPAPASPPASGASIVIIRDPALTQAADFVENDPDPAEVKEQAFDKLTMIAQRLGDRIARAFSLSDTDISGASTTLPTPQASALIGWNPAGDALRNYSAGELSAEILVTPYAETLLDDADAEDARTTLGASTVGHAVFTAANEAAARAALDLYSTAEVDALLAAQLASLANTAETSVRGFKASNTSGSATSQLDITWDQVTVQDSSGYTRNIGSSGGTIVLDINDAQTGAEANKRDQSGTFAASSTVNIFAIYNGTTKAVVASTAAITTGPTLPSGYTHWAYLTTVVLDGSSQLYNVYAYGSKVFYEDGRGGFTLTATSRTQITISTYVPSVALEFGVSGWGRLNTGGVGHNNILNFYVVNAATVYASPLSQNREGAGSNTTSGGAISLVVPNTGYFGYANDSNAQSGSELNINWYSVPNGA